VGEPGPLFLPSTSQAIRGVLPAPRSCNPFHSAAAAARQFIRIESSLDQNLTTTKRAIVERLTLTPVAEGHDAPAATSRRAGRYR